MYRAEGSMQSLKHTSSVGTIYIVAADFNPLYIEK
jgi:hypothetical protein